MGLSSKMAMTGVKVADECVEAWNDIKMKKNMKYFVMMIKDKKQIVIEHRGEAEGTWEAFLAQLPEDQPRYGVFDVAYQTDDGRTQSKLVFINWSPDDKANVRDKMLYSGTKDAIKKKLTGCMKEVQANDLGDLDEDRVKELTA